MPYHKLTASLSYAYKSISAYYQHMFNGEVFTTTDNASEHILPFYNTANIGFEYDYKNEGNYQLGVQILNIWNEAYASVLNRPMPGRNFNVYLNLNF